MIRRISAFILAAFMITLLPMFASAEEEIIRINEGVSYSVIENGVRNDNGVTVKRVDGLLEIPGYGKSSANYKYRRVGILRFNLESSKDEILAADGVYLSIGCNDNYDGGATVGNDTDYGFLDIVRKEIKIGVYGVSNLNNTWGFGSSRSEMLASGTDFDKTLLTVLDGDNLEKITSTSSFNHHYWGYRLCSDDENFMNYIKNKIRNGEYVIDISFEIDDIGVSPETYQAFSIIAASTTTYTSSYIDPFKSAIRWYQKKKSDVNTLESVEFVNGILNEKFDKNAVDYTSADESKPENEYKKYQKTYNVAVFDENSDTTVSFVKTSSLSAVAGAVLTGRIGDVLKIPVVSESGITKTYIFNLVSAEDAGYTENGKLEVEKFEYENTVFESGKLINMKANLKNNSNKTKEVARVSFFTKDNGFYKSFVKIYDDVLPGFYPEISAGVNAEESDSIVSYFADLTDKTNPLSFFIPIGNLVSLSSKEASSIEKREGLIEYYYKDISIPEITISGKWSEGNKNAVCYIVKSDYDVKTFDCTTQSAEDKFTYINALTTDASGYYGFDAKISETGIYKIGIIDENGIQKEVSFYFASPADKDDALLDLYETSSVAELKNKLMLGEDDETREEKVLNGEVPYNYIKLLGFSLNEFSEGIAEDNFLNVFFNMIKESDDYREIPRLYSNALTLEKLNSGKISDVSEYKDMFSLSEDALLLYHELESRKEDISENKMSGNNFLSTEEVNPVFRTEVLLQGISYIPNIERVEDIITTYADELSVTDSLGKYNQLNPIAKKKVIDSLEPYLPFNTVEEFKAKFIDIVASVYAEYIYTSAAPGGGGGGGGGASSGNGPVENIEISGVTSNQNELTSDIINNERICNFSDLDGYDWAEEAVVLLYETKVIDGVSKDSFNPSGEVKREEFIKLTSSLYNSGSEKISFSDVDSNGWYVPYIEKAVSAGIIKGINENKFGVGMGITREDMAVIICRILGAEEEETSEASFADDLKISEYAKNAVYFLKNKGIVKGDEMGNYNPKKIMTRAEAAVVVYNIISLLNK